MVNVDGIGPLMVSAKVGLPGRWYVVDAEVWVEAGAQGAGGVVVTAQVKGDALAVIDVCSGGEFLTKMEEALATASPFPSECRLLPVAIRPDADLHTVRVQRPGRTAAPGRVDVRPMDGGGLALEVRLGSDALTNYLAEGQQVVDLLRRLVASAEPDDEEDAAPGRRA